MTTETVYGDAGFFYIPDLGVKLPLFERNKNVAGQTIVDRENSAEIFRHFGGSHCDYIADHASQGFNAIKKCTLGMAAVVQTRKDAKIYMCVAIMPGTNIKTNLVTCCGQKLTKVQWADLCCYCCNDSEGKSITMVFFKETAHFKHPIYKVDDEQ